MTKNLQDFMSILNVSYSKVKGKKLRQVRDNRHTAGLF